MRAIYKVIFITFMFSTTLIAETTAFKVGYSPIKPFIFEDNNTLQGFDYDMWQFIANKINVETEFVAYNNLEELFNAIENNEVDAGISALSITSDREDRFNFSYSYFDAGLQVMTNYDSPNEEHSLNYFLYILFTKNIFFIIGGFILILLVVSHIIWIMQYYQKDSEFPKEYYKGIKEVFWWTASTAATVGYGSKVPKGFLSRVIGFIWLFAGAVIFAYLIAHMTSNITIQNLDTNIKGLPDLYYKKVGVEKDSSADFYLDPYQVEEVKFNSINDALQALHNNDVDGIVSDKPILLYYIHVHKGTPLRLVGPILKPEKYAIAIPHDSIYREKINKYLLKFRESPKYAETYDKWFDLD